MDGRLRLMFSAGLILVLSVAYRNAAPFSEESTGKANCETRKVICDPGWKCQLGVLVFSSDREDECGRKDQSDCSTETQSGSTEVYCVRQGHLYKGEMYDDVGLLNRFMASSRRKRGTCVEMCGVEQPCPEGLLCISNGCGHVCAKKP